MSAGHRHSGGFGLNSQALDRLLSNVEVQQHLFQPRKIDENFDIPYLGGYSNDGKTIYFDRHLPKTLTLEEDGRKIEINPVDFLVLHESLEKALIDVLGYTYAQAHKAATAYERRGVLQRLGPSWWNVYQNKLDKYIKADEHEKLKRVPPNLDMTPYWAPPQDKKLLAHLEKFVSPEKESKEEAGYSSEGGKPDKHCGPDKGWSNGCCEYYREEHKCLRVRGYIAHRAVCNYWEDYE